MECAAILQRNGHCAKYCATESGNDFARRLRVIAFLRSHWSMLLLSGAPAAIALHALTPKRHMAFFFTSVASIIPLAAYIGRATEELAHRLGGGLGGLLNATFGNVAALIIGALALRSAMRQAWRSRAPIPR
jgi:Ca2+/H+ antiporter